MMKNKMLFYEILAVCVLVIVAAPFYSSNSWPKEKTKPRVSIQEKQQSPVLHQEQTTADSRFGIWSPGYSQNKELYLLFLESGARQTIWSFSWKQASQNPGFLSLIESDISKATEDGVTVVLVLKTGVDWEKVKESNFPYPIEDWRASAPPKDMNEWYDFVYNLAKQLKGKIKYYGVMDEVHWTFSGTIEEYLELLKVTSNAIHSADPDAKVIPSFTSPALFIVWEMNGLSKESRIQEAIDLHNWFFEGVERPLTNENDLINYLADERSTRAIQLLEAIYSDYSQYIDVYEFHSYNPYDKTLHVLTYLKSRMAGQGINKPIIAEIGTLSLPGAYVDETTRQEDVVRNFAITLGNGVSMACWFALTDTENRSCGLIGINPDSTFTQRPAYFTFKLMVSKLDGYNSAEAINLGQDVFAFKFTKDTSPVYILWSGENKTVGLPDGARTVKITDISGNVTDGLSSQIPISSSPIFVEEKDVGIVEQKNVSSDGYSYKLHQNYPNPFNPSTTIRFSLPQRSRVTLKVFDPVGREVATLVDGVKDAGEHSVVWNAARVPSGVYFYHLTTPTFSQTKPMEVIK